MPTHDNTPPDNGPESRTGSALWQVGDLALCIRLGDWPGPKCGEILTVRQAYETTSFSGIRIHALKFKDRKFTYKGKEDVSLKSDRFVKIPPKAKDEEDEETIRLYNSKQKVTT